MSPALLLQYLAPQKTLSRIVRSATRWTWRPWKDFLIGRVVRAYRVDMAEAAESDPRAYPSFNAFFTRALRTGVRRAEGDDTTLVSPADGRMSQFGRIREGRIVQAKNRSYSVAELLADEAAAEAFADGFFATIYLAPRDYHRVHMPLVGRLVETVHIPGRLFSVAPRMVAGVPRLFARNERLACHFQGDRGPFAVVMVGAMLVSGITPAWGDAVVPPYARSIRRRDCRPEGIHLERMAEMARFEMGSTVIVLCPAAQVADGLAVHAPVRIGQRLADLSANAVRGTITGHREAT